MLSVTRLEIIAMLRQGRAIASVPITARVDQTPIAFAAAVAEQLPRDAILLGIVLGSERIVRGAQELVCAVELPMQIRCRGAAIARRMMMVVRWAAAVKNHIPRPEEWR